MFNQAHWKTLLIQTRQQLVLVSYSPHIKYKTLDMYNILCSIHDSLVGISV